VARYTDSCPAGLVINRLAAVPVVTHEPTMLTISASTTTPTKTTAEAPVPSAVLSPMVHLSATPVAALLRATAATLFPAESASTQTTMSTTVVQLAPFAN
jgi:hypothetical protein